MSSAKRYQVFISSTLSDLVVERQKVISTVLMLDCFAASMEYFPATGEEQMAFVRKIIDDCDYYVLIIGGRYGSMHIEGKSFTELEFDYAVERKLPICAFLHKDVAVLPHDKRDQDPEAVERLRLFREKISKDRVVGYWGTADELSRDVTHCLLRQMKAFPGVGWVRGSEAPVESIYQELVSLRDDRDKLVERLARFEEDASSTVQVLNKEVSYTYVGVNSDIVVRKLVPMEILRGVLGSFIDGMFWDPGCEKVASTMTNLIRFRGGQVGAITEDSVSAFLMMMVSEDIFERRFDATNKLYLIATSRAFAALREANSAT